METAAAIAHELNVHEIKTNYRIFEWLKEDFFPDGSPVDDLIFTKLESEEEEKAFVVNRLGYPNLNLIHDKTWKEELSQCYPESKPDNAERIANFAKEVQRADKRA